MEIKLRKYKQVFILDLVGEFDLYSTADLIKAVDVLRKKDIRWFVINMSNITFIDSSGVGVLIKLNTDAKVRDERFIISGMKENVFEVIEHAGLTDFFQLEHDLKNAVKKCLYPSIGKF